MRSAQHGVMLDFPAEWVRAPTPHDHARDKHELSKQALTRYFDAAAEARAALAALYPWSPDLRRHWDQPIIDESEFEPLMELLFERRRAPLARFDERGRALRGD